MLEKLITAINKLQDVFYTLSLNSQMQIQLPQIVMVGAQSTGKSSTLESIVRHSFLPRGKGIVTRCPLVLQLIHCPLNDTEYRDDIDGTEKVAEWGRFNHSPNIFTNFDDIRKEIENQTNKIAGTNKGISHTPISLRIFSPKVVNLTLVDLPGLIKVAVGDQPEDIEVQTLKLIMDYIKNPNSIILAISSADVDLATSESLKIAKEVDPEGKRTLAVMTKLDRMENVNDAVDILTGNLKINIPVKLGIVGIVNRGQTDKRTIEKQLEFEKEFLEEHYPAIAHRNGILYLEKALSGLLMQHIQECLPRLKERISNRHEHYAKIMEVCGEDATDKSRIISKLLTTFVKDFCETIDGSSSKFNINSKDLIGGPAIRAIFDEKYSMDIQAIEPQLSIEQVVNYINRVGGPRPSVFAPEILFECIIKDEIKKLRNPSLKCAENVRREIEKVIKLRSDEQVEVKRFPNLMRRLNDVMMKLISERMPKTLELIDTIIDTELSCINTNHPDFSIQRVLKEYERKQESPESQFSVKNAFLKIGSKNPPVTSETAKILTNGVHEEEESDESFKSRKKMKDAVVIEKLIKEYFALEKKKVEDTVPKSIMFSLVNYMKDNAQSELYSKLYKNDENLLVESGEIVNQRLEAEAMLKALRQAEKTIDDVYEIAV